MDIKDYPIETHKEIVRSMWIELFKLMNKKGKENDS